MAMKSKKRDNMIVVGIGAAFVLAIFAVSYLYNPTPEITTPEQDAQMLGFKAEIVRTEADLRELEKLAYEYEIAYRHSYNGATAMYFKSLVEPIMVAAGDRREAIRAEEDILAEAQTKFHQTLQNIDEAWTMTLGTDEEVLQAIAENEASIANLEVEIANLQARKEQLGEEAWNGPSGTLDQKCLEEIGVVEADIKKCGASIEKYERNIEIIKLACRLQRGEEPVAEVVVVEETETEAAEAEELL